MLGIAGMLAKRSQKKVGGDGSAGAAPAAAAASTTKPATTEAPINDDPFSSFGERPSTAGSFGFNNIGGYSDDFDDFSGDMSGDLGADDGTGMEDQQIDETNNMIGSSITGTATTTTTPTTPKPTGGLSLFKNRSSVSKEAPSVIRPPTLAAPPPAQPAVGASIVPPSPFGPSTDVTSSRMDMSFMPPPPARRPSLSSTHEDSPLIENHSAVEEEINKKHQDVAGFLRTESSTTTQGFENSIMDRATLEPPIIHDRSPPIENNSLSRQAVINRNAAPTTAGLQAPKAVLQTPKPRSGHNLSSVVEVSPPTAMFRFPGMSSLESPVPPVMPPRTPQQQKSILPTPFLTSNVNSYRAPVTPDSAIPTAATTTAELYNNSSNREESFDDMFCAVLEYVQAIKDKNHISGEQMLDMEVQLDHVIATMNVEMLQMQQMEEELGEIQCSQEGIVAMYR
mmetsp:Transcript_21949/g.36305  ORF Transcript_21949/g.36305 Transcript_21949/m.36305 type:complete len:452 (-) Transcript_21949:257-1612(-)|eukprot:CAMPEP_0119007172 /NCGR_PEP_ID=MMETSP1176-20130426/2816_1 /TAXON_ID=265551 /ORGANISM="Synedropsis recta cf, Strain CCMP1620" /LENGTH=451 /DNA_ID=CAMNT_0006959255 /DNA_START=27 /DNA_END=1382 /DNA_ORIENTATION=+